VRFALTSPVLPRITFDYDMGQRALTVLQHEAMDDGQNGRYVCTHVLTPATPEHPISVPLTLAHKEGVDLDGSNPVLLLGYGAYGVCVDVGFKVEYLPLLQRGWVLAFAHPRGGGELGRAWHQDGRGERKGNSIVDYLRCAEWLVEEGYAKKGRVAGYGGSAGGLLVAAAANRRPELFGAMVLKVPFLDIVRTMCDPTLPLTIHEFDEWGDPGSEAKVLQAMHAYSPYETLPGGGARYPDTLVLASLADDRVRYWEAAKWVAKARQACPSSLFLLRVEASRGHAGHATQSDMMYESAFEGAFLISALGPSDALDEKPSKYPSHQRRRRRPARDSPYARVPVLAWPVVPIQ
jgi:oligopeptidase B